jgi:DNA replication protein DnaC
VRAVEVPIDRKEANPFFNLVSELCERTSIIITSNKGIDEWAEMMDDEIMITAMPDRLLMEPVVQEAPKRIRP